MNPLLAQLTGGDRRSIGRADEVVTQVLAEPGLFDALMEGLAETDPVIRMRAADAAEKATALRPDLLRPHRDRLLVRAASERQMEVRWHLAQLLPRLELTDEERYRAASIMTGYLSDPSGIVRTFAMQALTDLAREDEALRPQVAETITRASEAGTPAMRSRGRRLLAMLTRSRR